MIKIELFKIFQKTMKLIKFGCYDKFKKYFLRFEMKSQEWLEMDGKNDWIWNNRCDLNAVFMTWIVICRSVVGRQRRTHLLLICMVIVFAVAWLPLNVFHVLHTFEIVDFSVPIFAICHLIAMGSACLNPVSYAFFNQNFSRKFILFYETAIR